MGDTPVMLSPGQVDSIVLGAAEDEARRLGLKISSPARDELLRRSKRALDKLNERGELENRRREIERNTSKLIQFIFREQMNEQPGEVTAQILTVALGFFCKKFPDFRPFCP